MPISVDDKFKLDLASLEQDALLDLYEIDLTSLTDKKGRFGKVLYLHNGMNEKRRNIIFRGQEYQAYPIQGSNFERSVEGASNRPTLAVSNLFGLLTALINDFDDCLGAKVKRIQVYAKYLDRENFWNDENPTADPNMCVISYFIIEQISQLTAEGASFVLAIPSELDGLLLPARSVMANTCGFVYRSPECGYNGVPVANEKDQPVTRIEDDKCSKCISGCRLRNNVRRFGGFINVRNL